MAEKDAGKSPRGDEVNIEADKQISQGAYSNFVLITHSAEEFVLDFIYVEPPRDPGPRRGTLRGRIIASPEHTKRILNALTENMKVYESKFGEIKESPMPSGEGVKIN